jgi:hypothetical protein
VRREGGRREAGRAHGARREGVGARDAGDQGARRAWSEGLTGARARWWDRVVVAVDAHAGGGVGTARARGGAGACGGVRAGRARGGVRREGVGREGVGRGRRMCRSRNARLGSDCRRTAVMCVRSGGPPIAMLGSDRRSAVRPRIDGGGSAGYWWGADHVARRTAETEPGRQALPLSFRSRLER